VQDDSVTFKVAIEEIVMMEHPEDEQVIASTIAIGSLGPAPVAVEVPPPSMADDFLAMLSEGLHSDVTIEAAFGEATPVRFTAHANVLSKRSPVLAAALSSGMRESATRTITVRDVPPLILKALLHFLYTDDFEQVRKVLREEGGSAEQSSSTTSTAKLQAVLAAAHKYQVPRLQLWTEQQLCGVISCEMVCSLLGLAHVYEATALERNCLEFMAANMANVVARPDFTSLSADCLVKFNMHCAGVEPAGPSGGVKRKRGEMGA